MEPLAAAILMCAPMEAGATSPAAVVDAFVAAYNRHDVPALRRLVAEDAEMGMPGRYRTGAQVMEQYETFVFVKYPKAKLTPSRRIAAGDMVAQIETTTGVEEGEIGLSAYRVDRGCITSMHINRSVNP